VLTLMLLVSSTSHSDDRARCHAPLLLPLLSIDMTSEPIAVPELKLHVSSTSRSDG